MQDGRLIVGAGTQYGPDDIFADCIDMKRQIRKQKTPCADARGFAMIEKAERQAWFCGL